MAKKKTKKTAKAKALAKKDDSPLARLEKAGDLVEVRSALVDAILDANIPLLEMALGVSKATRSWPEAVATITDNYSRLGIALIYLADNGSDIVKQMSRFIMFYRQTIIRELELDTTAELMLLDAAMSAYLDWMELTALTRVSIKTGTNDERSRYQARLVAMGQSHLAVYMEAMAALTAMKCPPIRILKVQAGENVAIQINEQTKVLEAKHDPQLCSPDKRKKLLESTPANQGEADEDSD